MHTDAYGCIRKHNGCIQTPIQPPFHGFRQKHYFYMVPSQDGYDHQNRTEFLCTMMCRMPRYVCSRTDSLRILRLCICRPMCMSAHVYVGPCICRPMYMSEEKSSRWKKCLAAVGKKSLAIGKKSIAAVGRKV